ncbi:hypothetical protein MLD52_18665 [Puniceicoccaceae bacterium K14]|nr:hypothetical protein [Puniceicoccaceae bacterium K14]
MKAIKKIAIGCSGLFVLIILGIVGLLLIINAKKDKYDKLAIPFFEECIPVLSKWKMEDFAPYWAPEVMEAVEPEQLKRLFELYRKLGELESFEEPQFLRVSASTNSPYGSFVTYSTLAYYEKGEAQISCILVPIQPNELKIWNLQVNSNAFLPEIETDVEIETE